MLIYRDEPEKDALSRDRRATSFNASCSFWGGIWRAIDSFLLRASSNRVDPGQTGLADGGTMNRARLTVAGIFRIVSVPALIVAFAIHFLGPDEADARCLIENADLAVDCTGSQPGCPDQQFIVGCGERLDDGPGGDRCAGETTEVCAKCNDPTTSPGNETAGECGRGY
jgi:hypothetical protein